MQLIIDPAGQVHCLYGEEIDLSGLGSVTITRASHVEPDQDGRWWANLRPVAGPIFGPVQMRSKALDAERTWLEKHWLGRLHCQQ